MLKKHLLDERIHWGELEDMHLSKVAYLDGSLINIDKNNFFISRAVNHIPKMIKSNFLNKIKSFIFWLYALMKHNVFFYKMKNNFYN